MQINSLQLNKFENRQTNNKAVNNSFGRSFGKFEHSNTHNVAFRGPNKLYNKAVEGIAKGLGKLVDTKFTEKTVKFLNGESENRVARAIGKAINVKQKWFQHAIAMESIYLTSFYMYNTKKSKAIPEDQKRPMMINQALVTTLCTALGYTIDSKISKVFDRAKHIFTIANVTKIANNMKGTVAQAKAAAKTPGAIDAAIKLPLKHANGIANGISKLKSVLVFGFIYRYFSPVFITPIANRVSEFFESKDTKQKKINTSNRQPKITMPLTVNFASSKTTSVK